MRRVREGFGERRGRGPGSFGLLVAAGCILIPAGDGAHAWAEADCAAVQGGALSVDLGSAASTTRSVTLRPGETVTFGFHAAAGPLGTVTLTEGTGSPRLLLAGPDGTSVSFVAVGRGSFVFQFAAEGAEAASFTASCAPARAAQSARASGGSAGPRGTRLFADGWRHSQAIEAEEPTAIALEAGNPPSSRDSKGPAPAPSAQREATPGSLPASATALALKMQWRDQRYSAAGGPGGPEVDGNASGVDVGLNYKLKPQIMVGALAQFEQPSETLRGRANSLLEQGWMVGPVTTVQFAPGLSLEARAAWGVAEHGADELAAKPAGTQRRAVSARLANTQSFGALRVTPSISVNHFQETPQGALPSPADPLLPHTAGSGRIDLGPEVAYRLDLPGAAFIEPRAAIGGFWGIDSLSKLTPGGATHADPRLKAEAGVTVGAVNGPKLQAAGSVEEGDSTVPDVWSGRLQLSIPLK